MNRTLRIADACVLVVTLLLCSTAASAKSRPPRVAVVVSGASDLYDKAIRQLGQEVEALVKAQHPDYVFPKEATHTADFTLATAKAKVGQALSDSQWDVVVGFGYLVGVAVAERDSLSKPVFLPFATPKLQGLPRDGQTSGRKNLAYLTGLIDLQRELRRFRDVIRRDNAVLLIDKHLYDAIPNLDMFVEKAVGGSMTVRLVPVGETSADILGAVPPDARAVYLGPLIRLPDEQVPSLLEGLNERKLPTYAGEGRSWVDMGAFTSLVPDDDNPRRFRRVALNMMEAMRGAKLETFSTVFEPRSELVINMRTARRIGVWPRFELMTEAELLDDDPSSRGEPLTLKQAVTLAINANLDLEATRKDARIAEEQVGEQRGSFLPQVSVSGDATWLDPDVANSLANAEREVSYGVSGQQLLYAPGADRGLRASKASKRSVDAGVSATRLDTIADTAASYLNVLRTQTAERINKENLAMIRRNLALAEVRVDIGAAGRQEVFRWENEIADSRASVISASASRNQAEIALNRALNRPLEMHFTTSEPLGEEGIIFDDRVGRFIEDPWSFRMFREFMATEAKNNSPELTQISEAMAAQRHLLIGQRHQLFLPDIFVSGGFSHVVHRGGAGSATAAPVPGFPARDDLTWQLGAGLSFQLFDASRYPRIEQTRQALLQLDVQRESVAQVVEQRIRSSMHQAAATRAGVSLRRDAARAAKQNLELVVDAYRQGTVDVITLIDAQNQALLTELAAANAMYDFLLDFIELERAAGRFGFLSTQGQRDDFVARLVAFEQERQGDAK